VDVIAIQTGTVAVKSRQRVGVGSGRRRFLNTLIDREWSEPLPILAWIITHPDGVIVVDTGETSRVAERGYFPAWHPYFRLGVREWVKPEEEIGQQLAARGIAAKDVTDVVLTHLHTDHAGGLHTFPDTKMLVSRREMQLAAGLMGRMRGYLNNEFPEWFSPIPVDFDDEPFGPFPSSKRVTADGDVRLVPTPGHTPGHLSVVVETDDCTYLLAGDASYTEELMLAGVVDGVAADDAEARLTLNRIRALAADRRVVYLPSHDPGSVERLLTQRPVMAATRSETKRDAAMI
jgi:N-acyl homoserine lactone hydrolase